MAVVQPLNASAAKETSIETGFYMKATLAFNGLNKGLGELWGH